MPSHAKRLSPEFRSLPWWRTLAFLGLLALPSAAAETGTTATTAIVRLDTELGTIDLEIDLEHAPLSAANFLRYVDAGRYDGARFHRTVTTAPDNQPGKAIKIDVVQAGVAADKAALDFAPIPLERTRDTGLRHADGCLSMARDAPDTATSDFFLCVGAQPELDFGGRRNPDGQGFGVFGRVVAGMDVVRAIHRSKAKEQALDPAIAIRKAARVPVLPSPR
jgi:peptidyl-prolyl cis-trans isomerase A (cyclophilin A)